VRAVQSPATLCTRFVRAVPSHRMAYGGVYFELAQGQRRGLAFAQRARQPVVGMLWQHFGVF